MGSSKLALPVGAQNDGHHMETTADEGGGRRTGMAAGERSGHGPEERRAGVKSGRRPGDR